MGNKALCTCTCADQGTDRKFETNIYTEQFEDLANIGNADLESLQYITKKEQKYSAEFDSPKIQENFVELGDLSTNSQRRVLDNYELDNYDLRSFLSYGNLSMIDFSVCTDGVKYYSPKAYEFENGSIYKGEYNEQGVQHGRGIEIRPNGTKFIGYFREGKIQGSGRMQTADGVIFQGTFVSSSSPTHNGEEAVLEGQGTEIWPNGFMYSGDFVSGKKQGSGKLTGKHFYYVGEFWDDVMNGEGTMVWNNKKKYSGKWKNGEMHGYGIYQWPDGRIYEGEFQNGSRSGKGLMKWPAGKKFDGEWKDGKQHGYGTYTYFDSDKNRLRSRRSYWREGVKERWVKAGDS